MDLLTQPAPKCSICGEPNASWGIGYPLRERQEWFCRFHYGLQPEGQAMFIRMTGDAADD